MHLSTIVFYAFSALLIGSALGVVLSRNIFHSAVALAGTLSVVAALFAFLGADFLAAGQLLVYVGGVIIIMLFVVMWSQQPQSALKPQSNDQVVGGLFLAALIGAGLFIKFRQFFAGAAHTAPMVPTSSSIGRLILGDMVVPFEVISLILLAALVGAVLFSQNKTETS